MKTKYLKMFAVPYIKHHFHMGITTTSQVESAHWSLKRRLNGNRLTWLAVNERFEVAISAMARKVNERLSQDLANDLPPTLNWLALVRRC
jgi:hypothetical protein